MTLLYHNHDFEFTKVDGAYALDRMYADIPAALLQTELDTCWVNVAGESPVAYLNKYAGRAPVVHLKDFVMPGKKPAHMYELIGVDDDGAPGEDEVFEFRRWATAPRISRPSSPRPPRPAPNGWSLSRISPAWAKPRWNARP